MEYGYGEVMGKCRDCYGCSRLEQIEFHGIYRCDNYKQYIKIEKENSEDEKI